MIQYRHFKNKHFRYWSIFIPRLHFWHRFQVGKVRTGFELILFGKFEFKLQRQSWHHPEVELLIRIGNYTTHLRMWKYHKTHKKKK